MTDVSTSIPFSWSATTVVEDLASVSTSVPFSWSATASVLLATTSVITDDDDQWQIPFVWSCVVDVEATATDTADTTLDNTPDATHATVPYIQRVSVVMPSPTLVDGKPVGWTPTSVTRADWGRLHLSIGGVAVTRIRGKRFVPLTTSYEEPFSDGDASFAFPGLTDFDNLADFGINRLDPVRLRRRESDGTWHTLYEGFFASREGVGPNGVEIHCIGELHRMNLLRMPPSLYEERKDYGRIITKAFNDKIHAHDLNVRAMEYVDTGIDGVESTADFPQFLDGIQSYLSEMLTDDAQWTVRLHHPRTPKLELKDLTTVNYTVSHGSPGIDTSGLSKDYTTGTTAAYGSGSNGHCAWMGARFPNLEQESAPTFPLSVGTSFVAGDAQTGFAPFAAYLRAGQYGSIVSDDTYLAGDVDNVEQFQDRAGITVSGEVDGQTWTAAFASGYNQSSTRGAYVGTLWERTETNKRLYNAQGADVGPNPNFDPTIPRVEDYIPFGDNTPKNEGRRSAKQTVLRAHPVGVFGPIILSADPQEGSRFAIRDGDNLLLKHYHGGQVLLHVTRVDIDWQAMSVSVTVDEKARDLPTVAAIRARRRDVADITRRQKFARTRSKVFDDYGQWLCEDGAGEISLMTQSAERWNVQRIPAAPKGTIERISLALGSGLTRHLLNVNLSDDPNATIPGAARGAVAIFAKPLVANDLAGLLGNPLVLDSNDDNPWDREDDSLRRMGMIYAAGGPGQQIGFYPNDDPGDGSTTDLTGRFEDAGGVEFGPTGRYFLWVAAFTGDACKVGGRIYPGAPS